MPFSIHNRSKVWFIVWMWVTALAITGSVSAETITFQQGTDGYERAQDTSIRWGFTTNTGDTPDYDHNHGGDPGAYEMWRTNGGRSSILEVGNFYHADLGGLGEGRASFEAGPIYRYSRMFIRFRDVLGTGPGQVSPDADIASATLRLYNTYDLGAEKAAGGAFRGDTVTLVHSGDVHEFDYPNMVAEPKLNAGRVVVYPLLVGLTYGFHDGAAAKGKVTAFQKRLLKTDWAMGDTCPLQKVARNDPFGMAFACGPIDQEEYDASHPGVLDVFQDATEGFKDFDVTKMIDVVTGHGLYLTALTPEGELPTMDINYANAYHSSEFGNIYDNDGNLVSSASGEDIATRPMLVIELGSSNIPGDANGDGVVDVADLGILGANFNLTGVGVHDSDFNGDGVVDVADLGILGANWTAAQVVGNAVALVPEPTTLALLGMSVLVVARRW